MKNKKKKILFVMTSALPFPPSKGGAVQSLVASVVEYNETHKEFNIEITSIQDEQAKQMAQKYKATIIREIKVPRIVLTVRNKQIRKVSGFAKSIADRIYAHKIVDLLEINHYDFVIYENEIKIPIMVNNNCANNVLHLHNDYNIKNLCQSVKLESVFCISKYIERCVKAQAPDIQTNLLYNGIRLDDFVRDTIVGEKVRNQYGIAKDTVVFVFAARIVKEKGLLELVQAFNMLNPETRSHAALIILGSKIYGDDVKDGYLKRVKKECAESNNIIFTGYISHEKVSDIYSAADVGCLPTLWEEPLSLSVIEYMAMNMPVIISDAGGMVELIDTYDCGTIVQRNQDFVLELSKTLENYIYDKELRIRQGSNAVKRSKDFSEEAYSEHFFALLRKIDKEKENGKIET